MIMTKAIFDFLPDIPPVPMFADNPINRDDHRRDDANWLKVTMHSSNARYLIIVDDKIAMSVTPSLSKATFQYDEIKALSENILQEAIYLGLWDGVPYFTLKITLNESEQLFDKHPSIKAIDLRSIALGMVGVTNQEGLLGVLSQAKALFNWHETHPFCSKCGAETSMASAGYKRVCVSDACGASHFPRTDPVVIMLVLDGDQCLLGRGHNWPVGRYSALAGFMEPGESIEQAVRREVFEETAVKVGRVHYLCSQPWAFPTNLMIGCFAEAQSRDITLDPIEMEDAKWFHRDEIKAALNSPDESSLLVAPAIAIAHNLLRAWVENGD